MQHCGGALSTHGHAVPTVDASGCTSTSGMVPGTCLVQAGPAVAGVGRLLLPARKHGDFRLTPAPQHMQRVDRPPVSSAKQEFLVLSIKLNVNDWQRYALLGCKAYHPKFEGSAASCRNCRRWCYIAPRTTGVAHHLRREGPFPGRLATLCASLTHLEHMSRRCECHCERRASSYLSHRQR